jgi:SAM-dependent methyltransferase
VSAPREDVWQAWARRWRAFQESYVLERPRQLALLAEYVATCSGGTPVRLLDLCAGPGAAADAILQRLPGATAIAVDCDPWLQELGRRTAVARDRIAWLERDLRDPGWDADLPPGSCDAVTLVTALPWLDDASLAQAFRGAARLLAPGGLLLVADELWSGSPRLDRLTHEATLRWQAQAQTASGLTWPTFWREAAAVPEFHDLLAQRARVLGPRRPSPPRRTADVTTLLAGAGLPHAGEIWRRHDAAVLAALR